MTITKSFIAGAVLITILTASPATPTAALSNTRAPHPQA